MEEKMFVQYGIDAVRSYIEALKDLDIKGHQAMLIGNLIQFLDEGGEIIRVPEKVETIAEPEIAEVESDESYEGVPLLDGRM